MRPHPACRSGRLRKSGSPLLALIAALSTASAVSLACPALAQTPVPSDRPASSPETPPDARPTPAAEGVPATEGSAAAADPSAAGTAEPVLATAAPVPPTRPVGRLVFAFQDAPWPDVLREFAQWAGLTLDLTDLPPGTFSYYDNRQHTAAEAIDILNGYLLPRGYVLLRRDRFLVALKTDNPLLPSLVPTIDLQQLAERGENELVRMVVPVNELDPAIAAEEVRQLLGPHGSVAPMESSQSLIVQGFGSTLRQVLRVLENSTPQVTDDKLDFRSFVLQHLPAEEAEAQIRTLFGLDSKTPLNVSGARSDIDRAMYYRSRSSSSGRDDDRKDREPPPIPLLQKVAMNMQVSSLPRTNSLLVTATPEGLALVDGILQSIDVPQGDTAAGLMRDTQRTLRVYKIVEADEEEVAKTLDVLIPGVLVNEDERQETLHILATPAEHARVQEIIDTLDGDGGGGQIVEVITLRRADPLAMESLLAGMFDNEYRDNRPVIQADAATRTLVVRGSATQLEQVRIALSAYGEGDGGTAVADASRFRRIPVGARSAAMIAEAAERILAEDDSFQNTIRVVVPGRTTSEEDRRAVDARSYEGQDDVPQTRQGPRRIEVSRRPTDRQSASLTAPQQDPDANAAGAAPIDLGQPDQIVQLARFADRSPDDASTGATDATAEIQGVPAEDAAGDDDQRASSRVNIEVRDDQLYLYSGDPQALDQVEEIIRELVRQMPERTQWTVFYLRAAEAEQAAMRLYELTLSASAYDYGYTSTTETAEPALRVIPDPRTNALFVSGSKAQIDQAESLLDIIDAVERPESYRDRVPHTIQVQYANVTEVAEMLRELYKDYLTDPAAERRQDDRNSRDSDRRDDRDDRSRDSRSGSTSRSNTGTSPGVRMTLAVDERTSQLIIACDAALFSEVEAIVRERDLAARDTQPTVQLLPIRGTTPPELVDILQDMSPKIDAQVVGELESFGSSSRDGRSSRDSRSGSSRSGDRRDDYRRN